MRDFKFGLTDREGQNISDVLKQVNEQRRDQYHKFRSHSETIGVIVRLTSDLGNTMSQGNNDVVRTKKIELIAAILRSLAMEDDSCQPRDVT